MTFVESFYDVYIRATRYVHDGKQYNLKGAFDPNYKLKWYQKLAQERQSLASAEDRPLQAREIRLLQLQPGSGTEVLNCSLISYSLENYPNYEALSYTWGDPTEVHRICCDGKSIQVTGNLFRVLQRLRYIEHVRVLWIDALCINQGDCEEQGIQVQLMSDIYKSASSVTVWLGESTQDSSIAFQLLYRLQALAKGTCPEDRDKPISENELKAHGLPGRSSSDWTALEAIFWRPWFTRVWIVQEIVLAKSAIVWCGEDSIPWPVLTFVAGYVYQRNFARLTGLNVTTLLPLNHVYVYYQSSGEQEFLHLLAGFRLSNATNPVDKVYALLGLASDKLIIPDYTRPVADIYREVARNLLLRSLDVLSLVGDQSWKLIDGLPSWSPDWSSFLREYPYRFSRIRDAFNACGNTSSTVRFSADGKVLSVFGVLLDSVHIVGEAYIRQRVANPDKPLVRIVGKSFIERTVGAGVTRIMRAWEQIILDLKQYPTGEDIHSVLHHTLVAGADATADAASGSSMADLYSAFRQENLLFPGESRKMDNTSEAFVANAAAYSFGVEAAAYGRRIFTTKRGYVGLGPISTKAGDHVVLFCGGKTGYMLRQKKHEPNYRFLGEAFVHGLMNGEGFTLLAKELMIKEFDIA